MAVSASDVRSALSLPPRKTAPTVRKPDGISRELFALIGPSAPSLAAHLAKPRLKQKPNFGGGGTVKWEHRPFTNGARTDSLQLSHWVKASDVNRDYPFARYNVQPNTHSYSPDEYSRFLDDDDDWTKDETDYLFSIVHEYDLRWYVIHDRYDYPHGPVRAIEDLKDRYYSVCRKLIKDGPFPADDPSKSLLLNSFQFDKDREKTRKDYIASLEDRTPEEIAEEEALFIQLKRLEQDERKFRKERDDLLRTLLGVDSGLPDIVVQEDGPSALSAEGIKKKKKGVCLDPDLPPTPPNIIQLGPPVTKKPPPVRSATYDAQHCIVRVEPPTNTTKVTHVPVHLRSLKLPGTKASPKVTQALVELGVTLARLVMPTKENAAQLDALLEATSVLIETKKVVDRVDQDIRVLKARLGITENKIPSVPLMDVDVSRDDKVEQPEARAQSVVGGGDKKQSRRSISVSSIDTSASRTGTKRQKRG